MRLPFSIFLFTGFVFFHFASFAQDIHFNLMAPFPDNFSYQVHGMTQDTQGYLWLATSNGLYKYDGYQYTAFRNQSLNPNSAATNNIECVTIDKAGNIWLGTRPSGLDRLDPATGIFTHFRHNKNPGSLANDSVTIVMQDSKGTLWIGTNGGLDKFDPVTSQFSHYSHHAGDALSLSCNVVRALYEDKQGVIWVGTGSAFSSENPEGAGNGGLNKLDKKTGKFIRYLHDEKDPQSLIDNRIRAIFEDSRGNFWVGTAGDGLHTMNRTKGIFERHLYDPLHPDKLSRPPIKNMIHGAVDHITFISEDDNGRIWIGTLEGGMNVYDTATRKVAYYGSGKNSKEKLKDDGFWAVYKTRDNITWISKISSNWEGSFYKANPYQDIVPYTRMNRLVICYAEDDAGSLWITTNKGLVHRLNDGSEERFLIDRDSSSTLNQCYFIVKYGNKFWVTTNVGLWLFDPLRKTFSNYRHHPGKSVSLVTDSLATLKMNNDNSMWVGSIRGLDLMDIKAGTFKHFLNNLKDADSTAVDAVFSVGTDKNKNLWVGTTSGLYRLNKQSRQFKRYLNRSFVWRVFEDKAGTLWTATDAGLFKYDEEADQFNLFVDGSLAITAEPVMWITEDGQQNLWITSGTKGIIRLNKERTISTVFGKNQGVNPQALTGYVLIRTNGEILVADASGYFNFQPTLLQQHVLPPTVIINNFFLNNIPVLPSANGILSMPLMQTKDIGLNYDQNNFSFQFTNIDLSSAHEDIRLLYMLQNYDDAWHKSGEEKTAYYFNLSPGKYIFKVKAINAAGLAAEKSIAVIISPPWWKTWWAYSLAVVLLAGSVYTVYRNRSNQIKRKQAAQINTMVAAQEGERKRISRDLHDDVGTKLSALKLFLSSLHEKAAIINNEEIKSLAESSEQFITEVMQDVRQLLLNLSPAVLEEFGYATAVEGLVNKINETKQIQFNLVMFGMKERLQKDYELALYRITQELINNVLKHAEAKNVSLQIGQRDEKIILMIEDDGKGFELNAHKDGYGLHNLDARTQMMNGTMIIDSQPGKGTSVLIEIPYNFNWHDKLSTTH